MKLLYDGYVVDSYLEYMPDGEYVRYNVYYPNGEPAEIGIQGDQVDLYLENGAEFKKQNGGDMKGTKEQTKENKYFCDVCKLWFDENEIQVPGNICIDCSEADYELYDMKMQSYEQYFK